MTKKTSKAADEPRKDDTDIVHQIKASYVSWTVGQIFAARVQFREFMSMSPDEVIKKCKEITYQGETLYDLLTKIN